MNLAADEIKLRIIEEILHDEESSEATRQGSLKALRQSCHAWSEILLPYLFANLHCGLWGPTGLKRLYSISRTPRIASYVGEITFNINFNIADPHPAPFSRSNQRRTSAGFWQQQDDTPTESRFKKLLITPLKSARRRSSVTASISRLSVSAPILSPDDLFNQFDNSARNTISSNLGRERYTPTVGLPPLLTQISGVLSSIFSLLPNLHSLCLDTQSQSDFIEGFTHGHALQFSPVFGTFSSISDIVNTTILQGWIGCNLPLDEVRIEGGSPLALSRFLQEFKAVDSVDEDNTRVVIFHPTNHSLLQAKLSQLKSLSILYDEGFNHHTDQDIHLRIGRRSIEWMQSLAEILHLTTNLTSLRIGRKAPPYDDIPPVLFQLNTTTLTKTRNNSIVSTPVLSTVNSFPFHLSSLTITGFTTTYSNLINFLAACNGTNVLTPTIPSNAANGTIGTLKHLTLGPMRFLDDESHPPSPLPPTYFKHGIFSRILIDLRILFSLSIFALTEGDFIERTGRWIIRNDHTKHLPLANTNTPTARVDRLPMPMPVFEVNAYPNAPTTSKPPTGGRRVGLTREELERWVERKVDYLWDEEEERGEEGWESVQFRKVVGSCFMVWRWGEGGGERGVGG